MSLKIEDVLKVNFTQVGVQLLSGPQERAAFNSHVGAEVSEAVGEGITFGVSPSGFTSPLPMVAQPHVLMLQKERTTLELIPDRSTITRDYPENIGAIDRLSDVAGYAIEMSDIESQEQRAFGFNIEAVYELTSGEKAFQFISSRVFAPHLLRDAGYTLVGGSPRLRFLRGEQIWNITLEPRFGDPDSNRVFIRLNLHKDGSEIPSKDLIKESLREVWGQSHAIANSFNGSS
jgi:hypothetical protein